jgi:hypothetical protein
MGEGKCLKVELWRSNWSPTMWKTVETIKKLIYTSTSYSLTYGLTITKGRNSD